MAVARPSGRKMRGTPGLDQADHRPPRQRQAIRRHHDPRAHRAQARSSGRSRTASATSTSTPSPAMSASVKSALLRSTRRPAASRSAMSSTCAPIPAGCSTRRWTSPTPSSTAARSSRSADATKDDIERYYARPGDMAHGLPVIVLIDPGTASASEIVAGALQDHRRALIMGETSFGKGSVQTVVQTGPEAALRLTTARYYTPSGRSVQAGGIEPDIEVPQLTDPDYKDRRVCARPIFAATCSPRRRSRTILLENDDRPDPRFTAEADDLKKQGIKDFQLYYAMNTIKRLAGPPANVAAGRAEEVALAPHERGGRRRLGTSATLRRRRLPGSSLCSCRSPCSAERSARNISAAFTRARCAIGSAGRTPRRSCSRRCPSPRPPARRARERCVCSRRWRLRSRRDRRLSCRRRGQDFRRVHPVHRAHQGDQHRRAARADHPRTAGPLRRGPVPLPRHFHGGVERDPLARRGRADPMAEAQGRSAHERAGAPATGAPMRRRCCASTRPANMARPASMPASLPSSRQSPGSQADLAAWRRRRSGTSRASTR